MSSINVSVPCAGTVPTRIPNVIPDPGSIGSQRWAGGITYPDAGVTEDGPHQAGPSGATSGGITGPGSSGVGEPTVLPQQEPSASGATSSGATAPRSDAAHSGSQQPTANANAPTHFGPTAAPVDPNAPQYAGGSSPAGEEPQSPQQATAGADAAQHYGPSENISAASPLAPQQPTRGQEGEEVPTYPQGGNGVVTQTVGPQYLADNAGVPLDMKVPPDGDPNSTSWLDSPTKVVVTNTSGPPTMVR